MQILKYCSIFDAEINDGSELVFKSDNKDLKPFLKEFYKSEKFEYPKFYKMDAQCKLAFIAAEVLFRNIDREQYQNEEIAMVFANSESTLATDMTYWESTESVASPALFVYTLPNILMGEIAIKNKIKGENYFFVSENFDAQLLHQQTEMIFQNTETKLVVVGWVNYESETNYFAKLFLVSKSEAGLYPFTIDNINNLNK
ncbi:MAG: 3-oxoacyl-ACP synthase [Bacteroidales bacterium]|nr:MAG: 3-oxoacyl-ACP synthase [Bacteroidales bacterium]